MSILLNKLSREGAGLRVLSPTRLWFNASESKLVPEGHPEAAFLCAAEGAEVPAELAGRFGIKIVCGALAITEGAVYEAEPEPGPGELVVSAQDQAALIDSLRGQVDSLRAEVSHLSAPGTIGGALVDAEGQIARLEAENAGLRASLAKLAKKGKAGATAEGAGAESPGEGGE